MVHGYAASQGFFFKNFDFLANCFKVIAIDQLGWGGSSRPDFTCKSTEETEAWFIDSFEEWIKATNLSNFILLGHSFGGYVAAKYALKVIAFNCLNATMGDAGFSSGSEEKYESVNRFRETWKGLILRRLWESNFIPQNIIRGLGPWGPDLVRKYTGASASEWKVPSTFIYGTEDWMDYQGAQAACKQMKVPSEVIRVPKAGHFVFLENRDGFHSAVLYACRRFLSSHPHNEPFPEGLISA
ncbi:putative 1-acylglycerol-3-phosphate O-acyltransferase [Hibiscus syriacus]|uniref:1-acylglycerol-3-phosphate O-acyltransferase n=1 Tax=Hibiscus syriacus TaxID=106335 RepID=A0A6A3BCW0_HIBSY|nr:putative 1-acylglycerol-3-phosphate O-acyltransferase [Hibiscus syriacus]